MTFQQPHGCPKLCPRVGQCSAVLLQQPLLEEGYFSDQNPRLLNTFQNGTSRFYIHNTYGQLNIFGIFKKYSGRAEKKTYLICHVSCFRKLIRSQVSKSGSKSLHNFLKNNHPNTSIVTSDLINFINRAQTTNTLQSCQQICFISLKNRQNK